MDEQAFVPGTPETELDSRSTYLLAGGLKNKSGHATLTNDRVLFFDEFYGAAKRTISPLQRLVATKMQDRLDKRGPIVDMPLTAVTRVSRAKKMRNKDMLVIEAGANECRFTGGFDAWDPLLRRLLTERFHRTIVDEGQDKWSVSG